MKPQHSFFITILQIFVYLFMATEGFVGERSTFQDKLSPQNSLFTDGTFGSGINWRSTPREIVVSSPRKRAFDRLDVSTFDFNKRYLLDHSAHQQLEPVVLKPTAPSPLVTLFFGIHRSPVDLPIVRQLADGLKRRRWAMLGEQYKNGQQLHQEQRRKEGRGRIVPGVHGFGMFGAMRLKRRK